MKFFLLSGTQTLIEHMLRNVFKNFLRIPILLTFWFLENLSFSHLLVSFQIFCMQLIFFVFTTKVLYLQLFFVYLSMFLMYLKIQKCSYTEFYIFTTDFHKCEFFYFQFSFFFPNYPAFPIIFLFICLCSVLIKLSNLYWLSLNFCNSLVSHFL